MVLVPETSMARSTHHYRLSSASIRTTTGALALVAGALALGACSTTPFPPKEPRTQYDRYDLVRNQLAEQYVFDEFGRRRPNLRGRLSPKQ